MTLKLGMETGSLVNHVMSSGTGDVPEVGMGATILHWTDREAATVVAVHSAKMIEIQVDHAERTDSNGMCDSQAYVYRPNLGGQVCVVKMLKKGWVTTGGRSVVLGVRRAYHDYSF